MNATSVRLRLLRSEVESFRRDGSVSAAIAFPNGRALEYRLSRSEVTEATVSFTGDSVDVLVPDTEAEAWSGGSQIGIYGNAGSLQILVEKDFRRTSAASPDDDDRYPNPRARA